MIGWAVAVSVLVSATLFATPIAGAEPSNVGDVKSAATEYHDGGAYLADLQSATAPAAAWIAERAPQVARPAVVFDIDETSLSNWEVIQANDYGRIGGPCDLPGPCGWREWDLRAQSPVIEPTLRVFTAARDGGAAGYFITGRDESQRDATERNLASAGYRGYAELIMEPADARFVSAADFKAPQRASIESQGYAIIANLGDQPSDLAGGHAERTFELPNPFYRIP